MNIFEKITALWKKFWDSIKPKPDPTPDPDPNPQPDPVPDPVDPTLPLAPFVPSPEPPRLYKQLFWGPVWNPMSVDPHAWVKQARAAGLDGIAYELWWPADGTSLDTWKSSTYQWLRNLRKELNTYGMRQLLVFCNDNTWEKFPATLCCKITPAQLVEIAQEISGIVDPAMTWWEPVMEWSGKYAGPNAVNDWTKKHWPGPWTVGSQKQGFLIDDEHLTSIAAIGSAKNCLVTGDNWPMINYLMPDKTHLDKARTVEYVTAVKKRSLPCSIYAALVKGSLETEAIKAAGAAWRTSAPTPDPIPPVDDGADWKWLDNSDNCADAKVNVNLKSCSHSGGKFSFSYDPCPVPWAVSSKSPPVPWWKRALSLFRRRMPSAAEVAGDTFFARNIDGKWVGGKFDHLRPGQKVKGDENIRGAYHHHTTPQEGEVCRFMLVSDDRKLRSNWVEVKW